MEGPPLYYLGGVMKVPPGGTLRKVTRRGHFNLYWPHIWGHIKLELPPEIQNLIPRAMTAGDDSDRRIPALREGCVRHLLPWCV